MNLYIPEYFLNEHENEIKVNTLYKDFVDRVQKDSLDMADPSDYSDTKAPIETYISSNVNSVISSIKSNSLKKLWEIFKACITHDVNLLKSIADNSGEENVYRLYSIEQMFGLNDSIKEKDVKNRVTGSMDESTMASYAGKFLEIYDKCSNSEKEYEFLQLAHQTAYCIKKRFEWYPLGDIKILDDMYSFIKSRSEETKSDLIRLRCDRELTLIATWYFWAGEKEKAETLCNYVINGKKYKYSNNVWKLECRCVLADMYSGKNEMDKAAKELSKNILDYKQMQSKNDFESLNTCAYHEFDYFIIIMIKTYDMLEAITGRSFSAERDHIIRKRSGKNTKEKIENIDMRNHKHQWEEGTKLLKERIERHKIKKADFVKAIAK